MKQVTIVLKGNEFPCRLTLGAMRRFKRMTGRDVTSLTDNDVDDLITLMYCCTASACNADGVEFSLSMDDFADNLDADQMTGFVMRLSDDQTGETGQKKTEK